MDTNEFNGWYRDFCHHYPETKIWLEKQGRETIKTWRVALDDCSLDDALAATAQLHRGDGPSIAGPSQYPAVIRQLCLERVRDRAEEAASYQPQVKQPRWRDGVETYKCNLCFDHEPPTVLVLAPHTVRQLANGVAWEECRSKIGGRLIGTVAVACWCEAGRLFAAKAVIPKDAFSRQTGMFPVYDPNRMFLLESVPREQPDDLPAWLESAKSKTQVQRMANYEPAFAEF